MALLICPSKTKEKTYSLKKLSCFWIKDFDDLKRRMLNEELPKLPQISNLALDFIK